MAGPPQTRLFRVGHAELLDLFTESLPLHSANRGQAVAFAFVSFMKVFQLPGLPDDP